MNFYIRLSRLAHLQRSFSTSRSIWSSTGLFGNSQLQNPTDWRTLVIESAQKSHDLVQIATAPSATPSAVVRALDDISDTICQVYDAAEFCRNTHSESDWRQEAQSACIQLSGVVQSLNMHKGLFTALTRALQQAEGKSSALRGVEMGSELSACAQQAEPPSALSAEGLLVGKMLKRDFEKNGNHLCETDQQHLAELTDQSLRLGMAFGANLQSPIASSWIPISNSAAEQLPKSLQSLVQQPHGSATQQLRLESDDVLNTVLHSSPDSELRRQAYVRGYSEPAANVGVLEELLMVRHEIAALHGAPSWAHYQIEDVTTLAQHPSAVSNFLESLLEAVQPLAAAQMRLLQRMRSDLGQGTGQNQAWDLVYYQNIAMAQVMTDADARLLSDYLHLQSCIEGFNFLTQQLFGVSCRAVPLEKGEGWAAGVQKLVLVDPESGPLGTIYLDLHPRQTKFLGAAHFTLRCGRQLPDGSYQTPLVALACNFGSHILSIAQAETLFHEFGHALNSVLSRTEYQHLAGTRTGIDMCELPSQLLEYYLRDPGALRLLLRHHRSGGLMSTGLAGVAAASPSTFSALSLQQQVLYSLADQALHGAAVPTDGCSSQMLADLQDRYGSVPYVKGTHMQARNNHLVGYGGTYYGYAYTRCLAAETWQQHLSSDPFSSQAGGILRHQLLELGGAKPPHALVQDLIGDAALERSADGWSPSIQGLLCELDVDSSTIARR